MLYQNPFFYCFWALIDWLDRVKLQYIFVLWLAFGVILHWVARQYIANVEPDKHEVLYQTWPYAIWVFIGVLYLFFRIGYRLDQKDDDLE